MPDTLKNEVTRIAEDLKAQQDPKLLAVASLVHLNRALLKAFGQANNTNTQPLIDLQWSLVLNWIAAKNISLVDLHEMLEIMGRAGETAGYLAGLPA
jgi:hypothetical protein